MNITHEFPESFFEPSKKTFVVDTERKRLWAVLLDLLLEFDRVCKANGIKYMIDGGTLLGAVRHGGFVPWDDDIDVIMLREEYEKLNKIGPIAFKAPYFWQTYKTDPDHGRVFARLRNGSTTYIPSFEMRNGKPCFHHNQGVLMDIFIEDNIPDDDAEMHKFFRAIARRHSRAWNFRLLATAPWHLSDLWHPRTLTRKLLFVVTRKFIRLNIVGKSLAWIDRHSQIFNGVRTSRISHISFGPYEGKRECVIFPRKFMDESIMVEFEGYEFPATKFYDEYLTIIYGDWHKYVVGVGGSGSVKIDLDRPYTEYLND